MAPKKCGTNVTKIRAIIFDLDDTLWNASVTLDAARITFHAYLENEFPRFAEAYSGPEFREKLISIQKMMPEIAHDYTALRREGLRQCALETNYNVNDVIDPAMNIFMDARNKVDFVLCFNLRDDDDIQ
jgi:putative hydrolase of the HAD superfamily